MLQIVNDVAFTSYGYAIAGGVDDPAGLNWGTELQ